MAAMRVLFVVMFLGIVAYSLAAGSAYGWDLLPVFIDGLTSLTWQGQFQFDFLCYLTLSALWIAWRHQWTAGAFGLAAVALVGGVIFFAPYLWFASRRAGGDVYVLLLGETRGRRR